MEEEIARTSQRSQLEVAHFPTNADKSIPECAQSYHSDRCTKKKSPDRCYSGNGCSPLLYSEEDCEYNLLKESEITSTDRQLTHLDSSSSPNRSYQLLLNCLTSTPAERCRFSSSCSESEESEIAYTSQTVLLRISSSSSNGTTGNPIDYCHEEDTEKQGIGCGLCAEISSNSNSEWESSCGDSQSAEDAEKKTCELIPPYHQVYVEGPSLTYEYANSSKDVIQAVQNIRVPVETKQWALDYLNEVDVSRPYPVKRKKLQ